ncbi:MAG: hypothetical protein KY466_05805 [Gemmatimonadetes bacterium]|nr:hypothetical protein [Gemmatimonadota bacterium]
MKRSATVLAAGLVALAAGCGEGDPDDGGRLNEAERQALAAAEALADSAEEALAPVPLLTASERSALRRHLNAAHLASARQLGVAVRDSAHVARLAAAGDLVRLQDSTTYWVVRELEHSLPYVTPDARAMLEELGRRFHQRLDSLGIPRYRFEISSVLRTAALQADLRRGNSNASRGTSSHQFGTTVDVAYNLFSPPATTAPALAALETRLPGDPELRTWAVERAREALAGVASDRSEELKAVLGEVLRAMQEEGRLQALLERAQPVYHLTVSRRYPGTADRPAAE